jgi:D-inositol-3-phosphate glycosyltransferase
MTRIALLSFHTCPLAALGTRYAGGMNVHVLNLAKELGRQGVMVDVYSRVHLGMEGAITDLGENSRLIHIKAGPEQIDGEKLFRYLPQFVESVSVFAHSERLRYDVVHSHFWLAAWAGSRLAWRWNVPHLVTFHTFGEVKLRAHHAHRESQLRLREERQAVNVADHIVVFSPHERDMLWQHYGISPEDTSVVPCGVDLALFHPIDRSYARQRIGLDTEDKVIIFVGRVEPLKGLELLLDTIACMVDRRALRVLIVGGESDRDTALEPLKVRANSLGLATCIQFVGAVNSEEMPLYYNAADLCVVPSYHESFGLVALEAMACGIPVVAARVGGLQTLIQHGETGYLVDCQRPEFYIEPIQNLLSNQGLASDMGRLGIISARNRTWMQVCRDIEEVYSKVLRSGVDNMRSPVMKAATDTI